MVTEGKKRRLFESIKTFQEWRSNKGSIINGAILQLKIFIEAKLITRNKQLKQSEAEVALNPILLISHSLFFCLRCDRASFTNNVTGFSVETYICDFFWRIPYHVDQLYKLNSRASSSYVTTHSNTKISVLCNPFNSYLTYPNFLVKVFWRLSLQFFLFTYKIIIWYYKINLSLKMLLFFYYHLNFEKPIFN